MGKFLESARSNRGNEAFLPKEHPSEFPYEPYNYYEAAVPSREELFGRSEKNLTCFGS